MKLRTTLLGVILVLILSLSGAVYAQDAGEMFKVGIWEYFLVDAFKAQMAELGYIEGVNITYLISGNGEYTPETAQALIDQGVDVLVTTADLQAAQLQALTTEIPIVFMISDDPVTTGVIKDLVTPGTNATGNVTTNSNIQRLQMVAEIDPTAKKVYVVLGEQNPALEILQEMFTATGAELGIEVEYVIISEFQSALQTLEALPQDGDWLLLTPFIPDELFFSAELIEIAAAHNMGIANIFVMPTPGSAMGYGADLNQMSIQSTYIVDRILRGANPADMAVQTLENALMVNLEAAAQIDLEIPTGVLRRAQVISRPGDFDNLATPEAGS